MFQSTEILQFSLLKASMFSGNIFSPMGKLFLQKNKKIYIYQCEDRFALLPPPSNQFLNETSYFSTVDLIKHQCFTNGFHENTNQFRQANICFHQWKDLFTLLGNHFVNLIDFFSVTGSATILGNESINVFNNEKKNPPAGKLLLQKLIQVYCSGKVTLYYFETCLFQWQQKISLK